MSTLKTNTIKNTDDVEMYLAKAWVNFNGTGTVAIRAAGTVSSITDLGTGNYSVNFTTAMVDTNYTVVCGNGQDNALNGGFRVANPDQTGTNSTAAYARVVSSYIASGTNRVADDCLSFNVTIFR